MTRRLDAVIFDVDGTLVDSERDGHRVAFNRAFEDLDLPFRWDEALYGELLLVTGGKERLRHFLSGENVGADDIDRLVPELHRLKNEHFLKLVTDGAIPARPGVERVIRALEERRTRIAIATTGSREWVEPLVDSLFGLERFEHVVCGDDVSTKKPDPELYNVTLDRLGVAPTNSVAIEDSLQGLRSAKAAGVTCIVVTNDYTKNHDLSAADLLLHSYDELTPERIEAVHAQR
ncbi:MAG TPA: HAD-IA family hydrolase [Actinomycetota bacterium]|nr:HAD-IA family hydrolase [Actinomycetota bacterium]